MALLPASKAAAEKEEKKPVNEQGLLGWLVNAIDEGMQGISAVTGGLLGGKESTLNLQSSRSEDDPSDRNHIMAGTGNSSVAPVAVSAGALGPGVEMGPVDLPALAEQVKLTIAPAVIEAVETIRSSFAWAAGPSQALNANEVSDGLTFQLNPAQVAVAQADRGEARGLGSFS